MPVLLRLFISFLFIGLGAFGGGLVTIPLIQHELVVAQRWMGFEEMSTIVAIAQMTPGPIGINAATFTGFRVIGISGALAATVAVILPSILILILLVPFIDRFKKRGLQKFGRGIQAGVLSLILFATLSYGSAAIKGWFDLVLAGVSFLLLVVFEGKLHPAVVILVAGIIGLVVF